MKKIFRFTLFSILSVLALAFSAFAKDGNEEVRLILSAPSGFYEGSLSLTVSCTDKNALITYTTDCSKPTLSSRRYTSPLLLKDASTKPNLYSARTDTSVQYDRDLLDRRELYRFQTFVPDHPVDKCHTLRFAAYSRRGTLLAEAQAVYFIGFEEKTAYKDIYICSITAEVDDLYGYENGILVNGAPFDLQKEQDREDHCLDEIDWWWWDSNRMARGEEGTRRCRFSLFSPDRDAVIDQESDVHLYGGSTRAMLPKSFKVKADKAKGDEAFATPFFTTSTERTLILDARPSYPSWNARAPIIRALLPEMVLSHEQTPCAVFVEGEYAGFCYIIKDTDAELIYENCSVNKKNVLMVENREVKEGGRAEKYYREFMDEVRLALDSDIVDPTAKMNELMDLDNYAELLAALVYLDERDWVEFGNNYLFWRSIVPEKDEYGDGRWRAYYFDLDSPWEQTVDFDTFTFLRDNYLTLQKKLLENEDYRKLFVRKIIELGTDKLAPERCEEVVREHFALMGEQIDLQLTRYYGSDNDYSTAAKEQEMIDFFNTRYDYVWSFLTESFGADWLENNGLVQYPE